MATILNDAEIKKLIGSVILDGDPSSIRPNAYILRLGNEGEFINSGKEFELGKGKTGIRVAAGHSVAVTAFETIDFRKQTVDKIYPGCALHGIMSPTTDLSREGIVAPTTQVDAGYTGTLNWTLNNTSNQERSFLHKERLYRLTIFRLDGDEVPKEFYDGDYQERKGYIRSNRKGPPVGMRASEWVDAMGDEGPEALLEHMMKSGYPWHILGQRLKTIDQQFKMVSEEYGTIADSLDKLDREFKELSSRQDESTRDLPALIGKALAQEASALQNRWMIAAGSFVAGVVGIGLTIVGNPGACVFVKANSVWIGLTLVLAACGAGFILARGTSGGGKS